MSKGKYYFSKSLEKGLSILSLFTRETPVMTQSEIAKTLNLNMTSTFRYTNTLVELGFLEKDAGTKAIRPSIFCLLFCTNLMRSTDHLRLIKSVVDRIHGEQNISIDVAFAVDDTLVRIYYREAAETLTYSLPDFSKNCLHNTSLGKAWLSGLPEDHVEEKLGRMVLTAKTVKTIVDKEILLSEIKKAKTRQYAMSVEEYLPGLITIGSPLLDSGSGMGVGAVSFNFSILQNTAAEIEAEYADLIREAAKSISELLPPGKNRG